MNDRAQGPSAGGFKPGQITIAPELLAQWAGEEAEASALGISVEELLQRRRNPHNYWADTDFTAGPDGQDGQDGHAGPAPPRKPRSAAASRPAKTGPLDETSLAAMIRDGVPDPVRLCDGMLYAGGLHCISGAPDCGKTTLGLWWVLRVLREGGAVLVLDEEGGPEITADKLRSMGATAADVKKLHYVCFPYLSWGEADLDRLSQTLSAVHPQLVLWDSSAAFLAIAGLDENSAADTTRFWVNVLTPCARMAKAAVLIIDHDPKATEPSRYARGSGAKLAATDVMMKLTVSAPFDRTHDGLLKMKVTKDRRGWLRRRRAVGGRAQLLRQLRHRHRGDGGGQRLDR